MKKLVLVVVVAIVAYAGWRWQRGSASVADDHRLALDRLWIDHMPQNPRDEISVFLAITEEPIGIFQTASQWRGKYELFQHDAKGDELRVTYPQTGDRETVRARATKCDEKGWEYCLELKGASRGVKKYYSQEGWEVGSLAAGDALVHKLEK
jgi:hypothetical protein